MRVRSLRCLIAECRVPVFPYYGKNRGNKANTDWLDVACSVSAFFFTAREMCPLSACSFSRGVTSNPDNAKRKLRVHVLLLLLKAKTITEFTRDTGNELANRVVA